MVQRVNLNVGGAVVFLFEAPAVLHFWDLRSRAVRSLLDINVLSFVDCRRLVYRSCGGSTKKTPPSLLLLLANKY
jgi:hypothetical protein